MAGGDPHSSPGDRVRQPVGDDEAIKIFMTPLLGWSCHPPRPVCQGVHGGWFTFTPNVVVSFKRPSLPFPRDVLQIISLDGVSMVHSIVQIIKG